MKFSPFLFLCLFLFVISPNASAQSSWSELDQSTAYTGNFISGVRVVDGYLFLARNVDGFSTLVKLSEEGSLTSEKVLGTQERRLSGDLYSFNGKAYFVGERIKRLDTFYFQNYYEREKLQFEVQSNLELGQEFSSNFEEPNQFPYSSNFTGSPWPGAKQEGDLSDVSDDGIVYRYTNSIKVQDTIDGFGGSFDFESIWSSYNLITGEQFERTLLNRDSLSGRYEGVSDLLVIDSTSYLSAVFLIPVGGEGPESLLKLDPRGNNVEIVPIEAIYYFSVLLHRMERAGNHIIVSKLIPIDGEFRSVWEKRNLDFELITERVDSSSFLCVKEGSLRADAEGGVYALMLSSDDAVVLKHIESDLSEEWSVGLSSFSGEAQIMTANDGGVIVYEARFDTIHVARISKDGDLVTSTVRPMLNATYFTGPNPTSDALYFSSDALQYEGGLSLKLFSAQGQCMLNSALVSSKVQLDGRIPRGIYFASLVDSRGKIVARRKVLLAP